MERKPHFTLTADGCVLLSMIVRPLNAGQWSIVEQWDVTSEVSRLMAHLTPKGDADADATE